MKIGWPRVPPEAASSSLLAGFLSVGWQRHQVEQLKGGRARLETCGEQRRLCVRIDKTTGFRKDGDYFVLRGY